MRVRIVNVVATAGLDQPVSLFKVGMLEGALYDYAVYHCAYFKEPQMFSKVSVFGTGKMISTGTKTMEQADRDLKHVASKLAETGLIKPVAIKTKIRNIVATVDLNSPLDLVELSQELESAIYEPEQFSGLIWRPKKFSSSILVFSTGKLVVAGLKTFRQYKMLPAFIEENLLGHMT